MVWILHQGELVGDAESDVLGVERVEDFGGVVGEGLTVADPVDGAMQLCGYCVGRLVREIGESGYGAGLFGGSKVGADAVLCESKCCVCGGLLRECDYVDLVESDQAAGFESAVAHDELVSVVVGAYRDGVDESVGLDARGEFGQVVGVEREAVVVVVIDVNQLERELRRRGGRWAGG